MKGRPNENYGREMMELFSLGADRGAYTETDVREQARALTGWTGSVNKGVIGNFTFVDEPPRQREQDDLRADRQLQLVGLGEPLPQSSAASVVLREQALGLLHPDAPDKTTGTALAAIYKANGYKVHPVVEAILQHPDFYNGPRMVKPPVVLNAGLLRMAGRYIDTSAWWVQSAAAGQQLFYPPDVGGWDYTRWLDTATWRARWFIAALVQGTTAPTATSTDPTELVQSADRLLGHPDDLVRRRRALLVSFAKAQLKRNAAPADVETALRRLVASSPDLQTA